MTRTDAIIIRLFCSFFINTYTCENDQQSRGKVIGGDLYDKSRLKRPKTRYFSKSIFCRFFL
jgi:hypothetical protein